MGFFITIVSQQPYGRCFTNYECLPTVWSPSPFLLWWGLFTHQTIIDTVIMITCCTHTSFIVGVWSKEKINQQELSVVRVCENFDYLSPLLLIMNWFLDGDCEMKVPSCYTTKHHQSRTGDVSLLSPISCQVLRLCCVHELFQLSSVHTTGCSSFLFNLPVSSLLTSIQ